MSNCTAVRQARTGDALLSGTTLYGIDAIATSDIAIYAINTSTGVATQISTLTGLPSNDFFVDAATSSTPESGTTRQLFLLPIIALLVASRMRP